MIPNNNLSILPFYTSLDKQNHRKDYAFGEVYPLLTPDRKILPFQIIRSTRANAISSVLLKNLDGTTYLDITAIMTATGLTINAYTSDGYDVIQYPGVLPMAVATPEGQYYLQITDTVDVWYSEVFTIVRDLSNCLKISYWDTESLQFEGGRVDYTNNFKFDLYLPTQVGRPDYPFQEQVQERDGYTFVENQISEKTYKFTHLAPEYLLDAMRIIRMSDYIFVTSKSEEYDVDTFLMTPKWEEGGYVASVEVEFQCDTIVKKIGRGVTPVTLGDFNDDYNNDFDNLS
jgi:hypothetical protein